MKTLILAIVLLTGTYAMTTTEEPQKKEPDKIPTEKKEAPKAKQVPALDEQISIQVWFNEQKQFGKATKIDSKFWSSTENKTETDCFILGGKGTLAILGKPTKASEITDKDGKVWVVDAVRGGKSGTPFFCYVKPKTP
jgi:hypothetical protein